MPWTAPKTTWSPGELVTAPDLNKIGENLGTLKVPPTALMRITPAGSISTSSTSFVDISSSLNFNLTTAGGVLLVGITGRVYHNPGTNTDCYFDINVNGTSEGGSNGVYWLQGPNSYQNSFSTTWLTSTVMTTGSQSVKIQYKRGTGNSNAVQIWDMFVWIREVS